MILNTELNVDSVVMLGLEDKLGWCSSRDGDLSVHEAWEYIRKRVILFLGTQQFGLILYK